MLANTNYAQQERLQLGHMLKPLPMPRLPRSHSYLRLPLVLWKITWLFSPQRVNQGVYVCGCF